jgi:hypothetical protein
MNTKEIDALMRNAPSYRGTFSRDTIPDVTGLMIVNTDPSHLPGTHWIAIFIDPRRQSSAKHSVKDDHAFLWKHAIFRHLPSRNPLTDQDEILYD